MPRPVFPPTPGSSTDIKGRDGTKQLASLQMSFELPEPALMVPEASQEHTPTEDAQSPKAAYPMQASETVKSRRRTSAAAPPKDQFALPPPPTRSRKIIQMKPRPQEETNLNPTAAGKSAATSKITAGGAAGGAVPPATAGTKRKQPSATSAAGRKIARKTAHSLIERRRRSKMNEEFALLKSMIPACSGEMHKLAILQASIEYVRYLEDCVAKLKAQRNTESDHRHDDVDMHPEHADEAVQHDRPTQFLKGATSSEVDMAESEPPSPAFTATPSHSHHPSISPNLSAQDAQTRRNSRFSASTDHLLHNRHSSSASTSPTFGPQAYQYAHSVHSGYGSALTSPALAPQRDIDQEATAALLMLNQSDRRGTNGSSSGRGMSVQELLST